MKKAAENAEKSMAACIISEWKLLYQENMSLNESHG